ncbi:MAG: hypothetical protein ACYCQJ_05305 [Nitrososphaerales archaeon]
MKTKTHYLALVFGIMVLLMMILTFLTFSFGAYTVFNHPNSNVVAVTESSGSGTRLVVSGSGLENNTRRILWIDPQFTQSGMLNASSGVAVGNLSVDSSGNASGNFSLSTLTLQKITSDGQSPHLAWIVGISSVSTLNGTKLYSVTPDTSQNYSAASTGSGIYFFVTLIVLEIPVNFTFGQLFLALWTIYLLLFAVALNGPFRNVISSFKDASRKGVNELFSNTAFALFAIFPVVLWGSVILVELQQSTGIPTGNLPPTDPLLQFLELSIAPLREEIGFRVIPIGLVAFLILISRNRIKDGVMALWHPSRYLKKNDTPLQYKRDQIVMYVLVAISSVLFGAAHVLLGAGWDIGKVSQAAAAGVALGVLYYKYGFAATVLLHWSIDYAIDAFTTNNIFTGTFLYFGLVSEAAAVASTIVLIVLLVRKLRHPVTDLMPKGF